MRSRTGVRRENQAIRNTTATLDRIYGNREAEQATRLTKLSPAQRDRVSGQKTIAGNVFGRQDVLANIIVGARTTVAFTLDIDVPARYALIDADDLQPSHLGGSINPLHFIPEAQPRNRATSKSGAVTPTRIALNLRPDEIIYGTTAYSGPPVVNDRGEVIQGNGRAYAIKAYYQTQRNDPKGYLEAIRQANYRLNFVLLDVSLPGSGIKRPVLVRMLDVSDRQAIELGQYSQNDTEAITTATQKTKAKARLLTPEITRKLVNELLTYDRADATLTELIRAGNPLKVLIREGVLRADDLENYTKGGVINDSGVQFITDLLINALFADADTNVPEVFAQSPQPVQNIVKKSALFLLRIPTRSRGIGKEIGNAVFAFRDYMASGIGKFGSWITQFDLNGKTPLDRYQNLEIRIAELFATNVVQRDVINLFRAYSELVIGKPADMFTAATYPLTKSQAIKAVFGVKTYVSSAHLEQLRNRHNRLQAGRMAHQAGFTSRAGSPDTGTNRLTPGQLKAKFKLLKFKLKLYQL